MTIELLDRLAYTTNNFLTQTSVVLKILLVALIITGISTSSSGGLLITWYVTLVAILARRDLPLFTLIKTSLYPLMFVLVLGVTFFWGSWITITVMGLKVIIASTALLILIVSTPYPAIFKTLQPIISPILASILFISYRSLFILIEKFSETMTALRLRGAFRWRHPIKTLREIGNGIGVTLLKSLHLSESVYESMRLRGFHNKIYYTQPKRLTLIGNLITTGLIIFFLTLLIITKWPSPL